MYQEGFMAITVFHVNVKFYFFPLYPTYFYIHAHIIVPLDKAP